MAAFSPFEIIATSVAAELKRAAKQRGVPPELLDFDLLGHESFHKMPEESYWTPLQRPLEETFSRDELSESAFQLRQEYSLRIRPRQSDPAGLDLRASFAANATKSRIVMQVAPESAIPDFRGVAEHVKTAIRKRLLRLGMMIGLFEGDLDARIEGLLEWARSPRGEAFKMVVSEAFPPIMPVSDRIIAHYEREHHGRSLIEGVEAGALVFEYVKPQKGRNGRGCNGRFYEVLAPEIKYDSYLKVDDAFEIEEDERSIRFIARRSGYVKVESGRFFISNELSLKEASFKKTGSIDPGEEKEIRVNISQKAHSKDAVGTGVNIDVQSVNIEGTVGSRATVKASQISVGAQTHARSELAAHETARIKLHRGTLKAKEAYIDILENGTVMAERVEVGEMLGGSIVAHRVKIGRIVSNAKITASEHVEVDAIEGEGNEIVIDPESIGSHHERVEAHRSRLKELEKGLNERREGLRVRQAAHAALAPRIKQFQQKVAAAIQSGKSPLKADAMRLKLYKQERETLEKEAEELQRIETDLDVERSALERLYAMDLHAEVVHHGVYNGHTRITFVDPKTREKLSIVPEQRITTLGVEPKADGSRGFRMQSVHGG